MAKKRAKKAKSPMTITVRRVGETGSPAVAGKKKGGYRGPSKAMTRMTGAVSSARKAAARAGQVAKAEPTRVAVGTIAGSVVGKIGADMIHDNAAKSPTGTCGKHEATCNAVAGGAAVALGIGVALMGPQTVTKRYAVQTLSHVASFMAGSANALSNAKKKPVPATTAGMDDIDPFVGSDEETGASRRERVRRRREALAANVAAALREEDPQGAGTEGPELEEYVGELLEDCAGEIEGLEGAIEEVGVLPLAAAMAAPGMIQALAKLLKTLKPEGKKELKAEKDDAPVTGAILELEGEAPEELGASARREKARELRREKRQLKRELRRQKRQDRREARKARRDARKDRKLAKQEAEVDRQRARVEPAPRPAARPVTLRPIVIRTMAPAPVEEVEEAPDEDAPIIIIPSDEEIEMVSGSRQ